MIIGAGDHLTDAQWLRLLQIVCDDQPIVLKMPESPGRAAVLVRGRREYVIEVDGSDAQRELPE